MKKMYMYVAGLLLVSSALVGCATEKSTMDFDYVKTTPYNGFTGVKSLDGGNNSQGKTKPMTR